MYIKNLPKQKMAEEDQKKETPVLVRALVAVLIICAIAFVIAVAYNSRATGYGDGFVITIGLIGNLLKVVLGG